MAKRVIGLVVVAFVQLGCGADVPAEPPAPATAEEPPVEAAPVEAAPAPAPALATEDRSLLSWSFEPASADCNGWSFAGALAIRAAPSRSGAYSCKVCAKGGEAAEVTLGHDVGAVSPGRYVLTAWVRKRAATPAPPEATARIDAETADGVVVVGTASPVAVREEWDRIEATIALSGAATKVSITVGSVPTTDGCLFVDDVSLSRAGD